MYCSALLANHFLRLDILHHNYNNTTKGCPLIMTDVYSISPVLVETMAAAQLVCQIISKSPREYYCSSLLMFVFISKV